MTASTVTAKERRAAGDSSTRTALLDAAARLMLEGGYASVTTRRVGADAGVNAALVHYHFGSMDGLFLELFRRSAEAGLRRLEQALVAPQPLWALWELGNSRANDSLTTELVALARRHDAVRDEIAAYSRRFRTRQLEVLSETVKGYGLSADEWPPASVFLVMASVQRYLQMESSVGVDLGHADLVRVIERQLVALEGERLPPDADED